MEKLSILLLIVSLILLLSFIVVYVRSRNLKKEVDYLDEEIVSSNKANVVLRKETRELKDRLDDAIAKVSPVSVTKDKKFKPVSLDLVLGDITLRHPGSTGKNTVADSMVYLKVVEGKLKACYFTRRDGRKQVKVPVGILSKQ